MRKNISRLFILMCFGFMLLFTGCSCEPKKYTLSVNFLNVEEGLDLTSYEKEVSYGGAVTIEMKIPEGYEHTRISTYYEGEPIPIEDWTVKFDRELEEDEIGYEYSVGKTLSYTIDFVTYDTVLNIDMSEAGKERFEIELDSSFSKFYMRGVSIEEDALDRLLVLNDDNSQMLPKVDNKIIAKYGDYVAIVYNKTFTTEGYPSGGSNKDITALYGDMNHFTDRFFKRNQGKVEYAEYSIATRGNTKYYYGNNSANNIFYIGQVKEHTKIYASIPEFQEKVGFDLKEDYGMEAPNTFYLLSNSTDYSDVVTNINNYTGDTTPRTVTQPFSVDLYQITSATYDASDVTMDKIDNKVLKKVALADDLTHIYNRYDAYKIYIGENRLTDTLLTDGDRASTYDELYIRLNIEDYFYQAIKKHVYNIKFKELKDYAEKFGIVFDEAAAITEATNYANATYLERAHSAFRYQVLPYELFNYSDQRLPKIELLEGASTNERSGNCVPNIISDNGNYYVKVDKNILSQFILDRSYVDEYKSYDYKTGTAVLYVSFQSGTIDNIDNIQDTEVPTREAYSRIMLDADYLTDAKINPYDYQTFAYIDYYIETKGVKKYYRDFGYIDYVYSKDTTQVLVYFKTSLLLDEQSVFRDNFYVYAMGTKYENFKTPMATQIRYTDDGYYLDEVKDPIVAMQDKANALHGIPSFKFDFNDQQLNSSEERHISDEYRCKLEIYVQQTLGTNYAVSFKYCEALSSVQDTLYITNLESFVTMADFTRVNSAKKHEANLARLGSTADIYYFVVSANATLDFDVYLDPNNKNTCITTTKTLCDITGKPITIDVGYGAPREIRVKYVIPVYDVYDADSEGYYFFAK